MRKVRLKVLFLLGVIIAPSVAHCSDTGSVTMFLGSDSESDDISNKIAPAQDPAPKAFAEMHCLLSDEKNGDTSFTLGPVPQKKSAHLQRSASGDSISFNSNEITAAQDLTPEKSPLLSEKKDSLHFNIAPLATRKFSASQDSIPSIIESDTQEPSFEMELTLKSPNSYYDTKDTTTFIFNSTTELTLPDTLSIIYRALEDSKVQPNGRRRYILSVSKTKENRLDYHVKNGAEEFCLESCVIL